jgi:hypothetical protein
MVASNDVWQKNQQLLPAASLCCDEDYDNELAADRCQFIHQLHGKQNHHASPTPFLNKEYLSIYLSSTTNKH